MCVSLTTKNGEYKLRLQDALWREMPIQMEEDHANALVEGDSTKIQQTTFCSEFRFYIYIYIFCCHEKMS